MEGFLAPTSAREATAPATSQNVAIGRLDSPDLLQAFVQTFLHMEEPLSASIARNCDLETEHGIKPKLPFGNVSRSAPTARGHLMKSRLTPRAASAWLVTALRVEGFEKTP